MNLEQNFCYKVYVPSNYEKKEIGVATRVSDSIKRQLDEIAYEHDRTIGYVIRELLVRGLAAYSVDGKFKDEPLTVQQRPLAPVVAHLGSVAAEKDAIRRSVIDEAQPAISNRQQKIGVLKEKAS